MSESLQHRLRERLEHAPERRALAFYTADGEFEWIRFDEFYRRAEALAAELMERGLGRGDTAILVLPSRELSATATLAILLAGGAPLLIAPPALAGSLLDLPRILEHTARQTDARLVVCAESMLGMREQIESALPDSRIVFDLEQPASVGSVSIPLALPAATDVAAMQLTSGTTGFPRICVWEQRAVLAALAGMTTAMQLSQRDVCLNWTPLYHDMGLVNNFLLCLTSGVPLVLISPEDFVKRPAVWPRALSATEATIGWSPNFGFTLATRRVKDGDLEGVRLDQVRGLWNAAERIHHGTMVDFARRYEGWGFCADALKTNFGQAENIGGATFSDPQGSFVVERVDADALYDSRVALPVAEDAEAEHVAVIVGVGRAHPEIRIEILSDDGEPLGDGHVGEIALVTPSRMRGFCNDPQATATALRGERLCTGDLGYLRDGELFWVGRCKERITVRGKKLDPSEFEPLLFAIDGLREGCFVAFGVEDETQGTQRIVVVSEVREPRTRAVAEIAAEIQKTAFLRLGLTVSEVLLVRPRTLAKTSSGKRRHRHFRRLYLEDGLKPYRVEGDS